MKSLRNTKWRWISLLAGLAGICSLFAWERATHAASYQYPNNCWDCHGKNSSDIRPFDSYTAFRNVTTGGFKGSHNTHMAPTASRNICSVCHGSGVATYTTGHMNNGIDMSGNINGSPATGTYSRGTFFNWTSNQNLMSTCSNVNCHFETTTPNWGTTPFAYTNGTTNDCTKCHGAPPGVSGGAGAAGSHVKHDTYFAGADKCSICHVDHTAESNRFTHATSAAHSSIQVQLHDPLGAAGGSYTGGLGANFLPSQTASPSFGSCSNLYCHSQGKSATTFTGTAVSPKVTPTWGATPPLAANCAGCHGGTAAAGFNAMSSGKHQNHINNAANVGRAIGCEQCHFATTTDGSTIATVGNHVNKSVNIKFTGINGTTPTYDGGLTSGPSGAAKAPGSGFAGAGCASLYCHSDGNPGGLVYKTIKWNDPAISCNGCHGTTNAASNAYPDHGNAGVGIAGSNSHVKHADATSGYSITCIKCHSGTVVNNTTLLSAGNHLNGTRDVAFDATVPSNAGGAYTSSSQTCNTTYCHSNGNGTNVNNPQWGATANADCTYCHGNDKISANAISTNKHTAHINNETVLGTNQNFSCVECHAATVSDNRTIANKSRHVNGYKDFSGVRAYKTGYSGGSCTTYCHSSGQATPVYRNMTSSKTWMGAATLDCRGCHGYGVKPFAAFTSVAGEPNYVSGGAGSDTANTHQRHVSGRGITDTKGCADCHRRTVDQGVANKLKNYSSLHLNSVRNVNFAVYGGYTGHYTAGTKTCGNTYCHANGTPQWGGTPLQCNSCHNASNALPGAHKLHWESATVATNYVATPGNITGDTTKYQFQCSSCHSSPAIHAAGPVSAIQAAQVYFGYSSPGRVGSYTAGGTSAGVDGTLSYTAGSNCTTSYCHSDGTGTNGNRAVNWGTNANSATATRCSTCHLYTQASGSPMVSGKHTKHITTYSYGCDQCHYATTHDSASIFDTTKHLNKVKDVAWGTINSGGSSYVNSATSCSGIYCHSNGTSFTAPFGAANVAVKWATGPATTCGSCHDGLATGPSYSNGSPKANSHNKHVSGMGYTCEKCHYNTTSDGTTITTPANHVNQSYNLQQGGGVTFTPTIGTPTTASTCTNISCHNNNATAIAWGAASPGCRSCHVTAGADVDNFTGYSGTLALISDTQWKAAGHGSATSYTSGRPGANFAANATNECLYCHDSAAPHSSTASNFFRLANYSTIAYGRNAPCLVCHGSNATGYLSKSVAFTRISSAHYGTKHTGSGGGYFCWDCHDPHGDANVYMIHDQVAVTSDRTTGKPLTFGTVSFTGFSTGGNYAGASNKLCNACHTSASLSHYTASNVNDGHNLDTRCTTCHSHNGPTARTAFQPSNNCDSCHGYPPIRRDLVKGVDFRKQGQYTSGRFQDYTGGGGAHVIAKHVAPTVKASDGWAPCAICHSNGVLNPATHTMVTPVRPNSAITIDVKDSRKFDYRRSLGQERYTGAKLTGDKATNRTGSCSNVGCHFKPSKRWSNSR